jgi:alkylation response protein AidB-like acyl-CoA dehydrogenase
MQLMSKKIDIFQQWLKVKKYGVSFFQSHQQALMLQALRSKAVKDGDNWIINGQKVWTSGAHFSDYGILVVRHDPNLEKHKGMTFFFVDMKSPGIEVKPIKQITGGSSFNEVYFTDVVIPDSQRLGSWRWVESCNNNPYERKACCW